MPVGVLRAKYNGEWINISMAGPVGPSGEDGDDGTNWHDGIGPPVEPIANANVGDYYLDTNNGDVYVLSQSGQPMSATALVPGISPPDRPVPLPKRPLIPGGK